jgi:hypothetical protein
VAPVSDTDRPLRSVEQMARRLAVVTPGKADTAGDAKAAAVGAVAEAEALPAPAARNSAGSVPRTGTLSTALGTLGSAGEPPGERAKEAGDKDAV